MNFSSTELFALFGTVFVLSVIGTRSMRYIARRAGLMASPRKDRWHKKPVALHGGVGFFPAFYLGAIFIIIRRCSIDNITWIDLRLLPQDAVLAVALLGGSLFMFFIGLIDDFKNMSPTTKLLGQLIAASYFILAGGVFSLTGISLIDFPLTYLWFVGITNAVNMLDNMDGLSSGVTIVSTFTLILLMININSGFDNSRVLAIPLAVVFAGALCGFWIYNRPPASIFMGDSGSLFMGYVLAGLTMPSLLNKSFNYVQGDVFLGSLFAFAIPVTVLSVPIFDTTLVTVSRLWKGQSPAQGGRDHSSHRLVYLGLSEKRAVWIFYCIAAMGGLVAILLCKAPSQSMPIFAVFCLFLVLAGIYLARIKLRSLSELQTKPNWTLLIDIITHKQQAATIILDMIIVVICYYTAYLLRFEGNLSSDSQNAIFKSIPIVVSSTLIFNYLSGIYKKRWHLFSIADMPNYLLSASGATLISLALVTIITRFGSGYSRSVYIIYGFLLLISEVGSRLSFRLFDVVLLRSGRSHNFANRRPILIYGAGKAGKLLFEEILDNSVMRDFHVAGFVDDDLNLANKNLCGTKIFPPSQWVSKSWQRPPEIWVSSESIPMARIKKFTNKWNGEHPMVRHLRLLLEPAPDSAVSNASAIDGDKAARGLPETRN
jgi:UDP-GlcNAc:undecaprenyl-phosphate/decaprenyl-phosphate GlcNAc-1-phosphate transferase